MLKKTLALTLLNSHKKNYGQSLNTYTLSIFQVHKHFHPMSNNIKNMLILSDLPSLDSPIFFTNFYTFPVQKMAERKFYPSHQ